MKIKQSILLTVFISSFIGVRFTAQSLNPNRINDKIHNKNVKTVKLYPGNGQSGSSILPPIVHFNNPVPLILEFDELFADAQYYQARILHCNWDWTPSRLQPIEYLAEYNEFEIAEYEYSMVSKVPYTHYRFLVPMVKIPGNYAIAVYHRDEPENLILTLRFMVIQNLAPLSVEITPSADVSKRRTHQQINFILNYSAMEVLNPSMEFKVVIRQNYSWQNAITGLPPSMIRDHEKKLEYYHFNLENNFPGGNEYRYFEIPSSTSTGRNVERIVNSESRVDAFLAMDKPRYEAAYSFWQDLNGTYSTYSVDGEYDQVESDYINVHFFLIAPEKLPFEPYVFGELSLRQLLPDFKMHYDKELGGYTLDALLKEGYYEYLYQVDDMSFPYEGNHYETRNTYEIIIYHRHPTRINDRIVAYYLLENQM